MVSKITVSETTMSVAIETVTTIDVPNGSHGRRRDVVDGIVLHGIGEWVLSNGDYIHCTNLLQALGLSAHAIALPDGRIVRQVDTWYVAWHCKGHNTRTAGIEFALAGTWDHDAFEDAMQGRRHAAYTDAQLDVGAAWCRARSVEHEFPVSNVRTHAQLDPGRKFDPGVPFPLERFLRQLREG